MDEAYEIADRLITSYGDIPLVRTFSEAREWVIAQWPDHREWVGGQMLDNVIDAIIEIAREVYHAAEKLMG